jgi:hypothetical protein
VAAAAARPRTPTRRRPTRRCRPKTGAKHYVSCSATLEKEVAPALAAFEAACKATVTGL